MDVWLYFYGFRWPPMERVIYGYEQVAKRVNGAEKAGLIMINLIKDRSMPFS
jgi:hypothetical protein